MAFEFLESLCERGLIKVGDLFAKEQADGDVHHHH